MRPSEIAAGVGAVCLLLALLTWLLMRGIVTDAAVYSTTLRIFDDFALAEAALDRDILRARAGLLMNYDPLVRSSKQIAAAVSQLRAQGATEDLDPGPVDRLAAATKIEEGLTERFKSDNALSRNSLAYVGLLGISPGFNDRDSLPSSCRVRVTPSVRSGRSCLRGLRSTSAWTYSFKQELRISCAGRLLALNSHLC
jgi:hypothetical protein